MGVAPPVPQRLPSDSLHDEDFDAPTQARPPAKFHSEPPTRQKNVVVSVYQSLLSVFDDMTAAQKMEFVDLAARFAALDADSRAGVMDLLPQYEKLSAIDRSSVRALVTKLAGGRAR